MPESSEVRLMAECLHKHLAGHYCQAVVISQKSKYWKKPLKGFAKSEWIPINNQIPISINALLREVRTKGKKIIFQFDGFCFVSSLGLEGHYQWEPGNNSGLALYFDHKIAYYDDSRRFGNFTMVLDSELADFLSDVGPDYGKGEVSLGLFQQVITQPKYAKKEVGETIMTCFLKAYSIKSCAFTSTAPTL